MNIMFVLLAKRAFSDVTESVNSKNFLLAPLATSTPPALCMDNAINIWLATSYKFRGGLGFTNS